MEQKPVLRVEHVWSYRLQLLVTIPIFLLLLGSLTLISRATLMPWSIDPTNRTLATDQVGTAVHMESTPQSVHCSTAQPIDQSGLCALSSKKGYYQVKKRITVIPVVRPANGAVQQMRMEIHTPVGFKGKSPAIIFMHGAGSGTATDSYQTLADSFASAGFVAATVDKPVWHTPPWHRDYSAEALAYDKAINELRALPDVNPDKVGIFVTSESGWVSPLLLDRDHRIAFQVLMSPMLFTPRRSVAFFAAQNFSILGANPGYQGIVSRVGAMDLEEFGIKEADFKPYNKRTFSIPTFLAYGSKDVMTPQVEGAMRVMDMAADANNMNYVIRSYAFADHILSLGNGDTKDKYADQFIPNIIQWSTGILKKQVQTAPRVAGHTIYQSIAVPKMNVSSSLSMYLVLLHVALIIATIVALIFSIVVGCRKIWAIIHKEHNPVAFINGFGRDLIFITITTALAVILFATSFGVLIDRFINLCWGKAPIEPPGIVYWGWNVVQVACVVVLWAWARIFETFIEAGFVRGWFAPLFRLEQKIIREKNLHNIKLESPNVSNLQTSAEWFAFWKRNKKPYNPIFTTTKFGLAYFICIMICLLLWLLFFAFWGFFHY